jgi:hypothetical protein
MQTFLPHKDYVESAKCLDRIRLGKQRVECLQIMKALTDKDYGWQSHPAVNMWRGLEWELFMYSKAICKEWTGRGYKDTCWDKIRRVFWEDVWAKHPQIDPKSDNIKLSKDVSPIWQDDDELYTSHKSNLVRKNPEHYFSFKWGVKHDLPYKWYNFKSK